MGVIKIKLQLMYVTLCSAFIINKQKNTMNTNNQKFPALFAACFFLGACSSSSSSSGGSGQDARDCVKRTLNTVYTNTCEFEVNVLILKTGTNVFKIKGDDVTTRSASSTAFGVCRAPSVPVPNSNFSSYACS